MMMKMMIVRAAKKFAPSAAASRRRCPVLAARPGTWIFFLARQMSCSAACPAPRREKRSEQTIYDAATRKDLQIDFPSRGKRSRLEKMRSVTHAFQNGKGQNARREDVRTKGARCRARVNYFRRKRSEISPDIERNTSTASAPIMQNAIINHSPTAPNFSLEYASGVPGSSVSYLVYLQQARD
jgi:hypothetical protein